MPRPQPEVPVDPRHGWDNDESDEERQDARETAGNALYHSLGREDDEDDDHREDEDEDGCDDDDWDEEDDYNNSQEN